MRFVHILQNYVGSATRFDSNPGDIDIRLFYLHPLTKNSFHIKNRDKNSNKILDIDYWETELALNEILKGGDCAPFLFNTITSPKYIDPLDIGIELIENKNRLIGKPLIDGTLKYVERKLLLANGEFPLPQNKTATTYKQVYYACSDLMELYYNLTNNLSYPLKLDKNILDIKENKINHKESIEILDDIKLKILSLNINNNPDSKWCGEFIQKCYKYYDGLQ
jgi:hypothetical protein